MEVKHKVAVLSNVNVNFIIRFLKKEFEVYDVEGYGNELGLLFDRESSYYTFGPQFTFFLMDLPELIQHDFSLEKSSMYMEQWFAGLEGLLEKDRLYYISDALLWGTQVDMLTTELTAQQIGARWNELLGDLRSRWSNVRVFPYRRILEKLGENHSFSLKTWYLGKIPHTGEAQRCIVEKITQLVNRELYVPKKVLVLDLDNTLWGGLAGENDHTPIELSDDHGGLAYKDLQRVLSMMRRNGVLLAIASKNNEEDALDILRNHPHMLLREDDFVAKKINWNPKHESIKEISGELKLGMDSFVFWDDNPQERELIRQMLPQVTVPDFPEKKEELAEAMCGIYEQYFARPVVTAEDREKTRQYRENAQRDEMEKAAGSFEDYLKQLQIRADRVDAHANLERFHQLVNKTNQFNLTTRRYELTELAKLLEDPGKKVYLYRVRDCFGDYGIVAALIVDVQESVPLLEEFVLSCRVMGKNIEYAILQDVEDDLQRAGYESLRGCYLPTPRNKPVQNLYEKLGYRVLEQRENGEKDYEILFTERPKRVFYVEMNSL